MAFDRSKVLSYTISTNEGKKESSSDFFEALKTISFAYAAMKYKLRGKNRYKVRFAARNFYLMVNYKNGGKSKWRLYFAWFKIATSWERANIEQKIIEKRKAENDRTAIRRLWSRAMKPLIRYPGC
jgi:hypothetical protein